MEAAHITAVQSGVSGSLSACCASAFDDNESADDYLDCRDGGTMLLFSKRRMISMLGVVKPAIPSGDLKHLVGRLGGEDGQQLQGAWELAVLWALISEFGSAADPRVEQRQSGRPDCRVHMDAKDKLMLEVYTPTGDTFEFKPLLDPITQSFYDVVDRSQPGSSPHLYISYHEWSKPVAGGSLRGPSVTSAAAEDIRVLSQLERFWASGKDSIRITALDVIDATFHRVPYRFHGLNYRCQIPRKPQFVYNNLTLEMSRKATKQLMPFRDDHLLGLIVCDG